MHDPERGDLIDGSIGEGSPFQRTFGYYAHGVDDRTAILPNGWTERLILVAGKGTQGARGWCLEVNDLAISKYVAGREKDLIFTRSLATHGITARNTLVERLAATALDSELRRVIEARIEADFAGPSFRRVWKDKSKDVGAERRGPISARASIHWLKLAEGGRSSVPAGPRYSTVARFDTQTEEEWRNDAWSLVLELEGAVDAASNQTATVRFLSDEDTTPTDWLQPGRRFGLFEGYRKVAEGTVL